MTDAVSPPALTALAEELAHANHILAHQGIVDGFGHVSVRDPVDAGRFLISRSMAPAQVTPGDILMLDLDGETCGKDVRRSYLERFIHGEIYRARPDVQAVVHSHSPSMIPFGVARQPLRPIYHMGAAIGPEVPVFEIRDCCGDASDMLVRSSESGRALAKTLGPASVVLMRGHGSTAVGSSLREAVFTAVYAELNARLQTTALQMSEITFLTPGEIAAASAANASQIDRAWDLWVRNLPRPKA